MEIKPPFPIRSIYHFHILETLPAMIPLPEVLLDFHLLFLAVAHVLAIHRESYRINVEEIM